MITMGCGRCGIEQLVRRSERLRIVVAYAPLLSYGTGEHEPQERVRKRNSLGAYHWEYALFLSARPAKPIVMRIQEGGLSKNKRLNEV